MIKLTDFGYQLLKEQNGHNINLIMMKACFASFNTKGFSSAVQNHTSSNLPDHTHLTYDGCFNELKYSIGPKAKKPMELHLGYARAQNQHSFFDSDIRDFLTIFTKGEKDGEDRDSRIFNSVIILDISGSMDGGLSYASRGQGCRLELAKQAILMFYSKLRPTDSFGLVIFNNHGTCLLPVETVASRSFEEVSDVVRSIHTSGGTTLMSGFIEAHKILMEFLNKKEYVKQSGMENRLIMLTDVGDNTMLTTHKFIGEVQQSNIHTTIIGISDQFRSEICEALNEVKGFNYFCATEIDDLKKYLFENFSFTFFPDTFDIQIDVENDNIESIEVFGTVDSSKVALYNKNAKGKFVITRSKTSFPSELEIGEDGQVKTYGGLVLVKLNLKDKTKNEFIGKVNLSYCTGKGEKIYEQYPVKYQSPVNEQYYSDECLFEALSGFFYVYEVKNVLIKAKDQKIEQRKKYVECLQALRKIAPKSKLTELEDLLKKIKDKKEEKETVK